MNHLKHAVDSPHTDPWVKRIGKIILNFAAIELDCIHWLLQFSEDPGSLKYFVELPFAARVVELLRHVEHRSSGPKWRKQAVRAWNDALKLAIVRNQVAHNPIVFGWRTPSEEGEPDFIGIPNLRGGAKASTDSLLSKASADKNINEMAALAQKLRELRIEWSSLRDAGGLKPALSGRAKKALWRRLCPRK